MSQNYQNNPSQYPKKEETKEPDFSLILLIWLPLAIASFMFPRIAVRENIWKFKEIDRKYYFLVFFSGATGLLIQLVAIRSLLSLHFREALTLLVISWVVLIPSVIPVITYNLTLVQNKLFLGRLPLHLIGAIKGAVLRSAFSLASDRYKKLNSLLPLRDGNKQEIVGLSAHPKDYRSRRLRKDFPKRSVLSEYISDDYILFNQRKDSPEHQLVIGETGSGKSRLLSRLALAGLADDWKVVVIDFKGGKEEKELFSNLGRFLPDRRIKVVNFPDQPFEIFIGSHKDIADKMIGFLPPLTNSPADFYIYRQMRAIRSVVENHNLLIPKTAEEVLSRIKNGAKFGATNEERLWFKTKDKGQELCDLLEAEISQYFAPMMRQVGWKLNGGTTWSDDWDVLVVSLDGSLRGDVLVGEILLMDFDMFLRKSNRYTDPRNFLVIVDEAGALNTIGGSRNLNSLISRSRSAGVGIVIASQTVLGLGNIGDELIEGIPVRWLGRSSSPQKIIDLVGTEDVIEGNFDHGEDGWNPATSAKAQKAYIVDPDAIRSLPTFVWNLSKGGKNVYVYAPPLN